MESDFLNYITTRKTVVFTDSLKKGLPFISKIPRDHDSLFFVTKGTLLYEKEGVYQTIGEGQVCYIPRGFKDKSSAYNCDVTTYIVINFNFEQTLDLDYLCSKNNSFKYEYLFKNALNAFSSRSVGSSIICNGILLQIIGFLYSEKQSIINRDKNSEKIAKALEYLYNNYHCVGFEIRTLASLSNMSEKNFRRIFMTIFKKTPFEFLRELRINKAKLLLSNTAKSVSDIAFECGFSDVYSFNHSFKSYTGIAPTKYRNG